MRRSIPFLVMACLVLSIPAGALAQADAAEAMKAGRAAMKQGQFETARDLFRKATQTDNRNPEAFLHLGKAHYQLGEVDQAMAAWRRTIQLAPNEPYSAKMLKALRGELAEVDKRIRLIEAMAAEKLHSVVLGQCRTLLADKTVTDAQRVKVMLLKAAAEVESSKAAEAVSTLSDLGVRYPAEAKSAEAVLQLGRAKLRLGGRSVAQGVALLKQVVGGPAKPQAAWAQVELLAHDLERNVSVAGAAAMKKWLGGNAGHPRAPDARKRLVEAYLTLSGRLAAAGVDTKLSGHDAAAIAVASELLGRMASPKEAGALAQRVLTHLDGRYAKSRAYAAAIAGVTALTKAALPPSARREALRWLATYRMELALKQLTDQANAGKLPGGAMPRPLADAVGAWQTINTEFPAKPAWKDLAGLAERVRCLAAMVPWPAKVTAPKAPHAWSLQIALAVVKADADASAVSQAVKTAGAIVTELSRFNRGPARGLALAVQTDLLKALSPRRAEWSAAMLKQIELLDAYAAAVFADNIKAGRSEANAQLSADQKRLLTTMSALVGRQVGSAATVVKRLSSHLSRWVAAGHYAAAEQAHAQLAAALPPAAKKAVSLQVAQLWIDQAARRDGRLLAAGLTVARKLDPLHEKALKRCYALQGGLEEGDAFLVQVRKVWEQVIRHYKALEYYEIAEAAIRVGPDPKKADPAMAAADAYAQLKLAQLHYEQARRELNQLLNQYRVAEKITLTAAFKKAIGEYQKFITDHPKSPLVAQALSSLFSIAQIFEQQKAYDVAVGIYTDLAAFAAKVKILAAAPPGGASTVERAELAAAAARRTKAAEALKKALADRKPDEGPPAKISPEFAAAVAAYKAFIKARPDSAVLAQAVREIMAIALEYAKVDAWDVADGIYADLLGAGLAIRRPERLEFCRGVCQLGKVLGDHARQVLTALTSGGLGEGKRFSGYAMGGTFWKEAGKDGGPGHKPGRGEGLKREGSRPSGEPAKPPMGPTTPKARPKPAAKPKPGSTVIAGGLIATDPMTDDELHKGDLLALAAIRKQQQRRATRIAALRDDEAKLSQRGRSSKATTRPVVPGVPVLSDAELARQDKALAAAYKIFQAIRKAHPRTATAKQARGEIMVMIAHWRGLAKWQRSADMTKQFLADNLTDGEVPQLRYAMARDFLSLAAQPVKKRPSKQAMLAEVAGRFGRARALLAEIVATSRPREKTIRHGAQWDIANSFLTQARVVTAFSATLARGQYTRAAKELLGVAERFHDHPSIGKIPQMLWTISQELAARQYHEEAIIVWTDLTIRYPTSSLAPQASMQIAQTYQNQLSRPLQAVEAYLELNFARGGNDSSIQAAIFQIGSTLKGKKRWVEALHVLETFVDSFPRHASAGQALTTVGHIHQANEAWGDAIAAYRRVINEFPSGTWVRDAKWAIAECTINLSRWQEAMGAYHAYLLAYPSSGEKAQTSRAAEATRRIGVLKDLTRYQSLVDEKGQRKAFDAQYQIAEIVMTQLSNPVKAIIEYRKVADVWGDSHLADDAMYKIGTTYLLIGETSKARKALLAVAQKYPNSPLADDALYRVGQSFEKEALGLTTVTRATSLIRANDLAQKVAYKRSQSARRDLDSTNTLRIAQLRRGGKNQQAELEVARGAVQRYQYGQANVDVFTNQAGQDIEALTAKQLADRKDKLHAALRKAVSAYQGASKVAAADKADESLLRMAVIYADNLKDAEAAMKTYLEIVRQFSGTSVAEDASWRIAQYQEKQRKYGEAIDAYKAFLRNYRRSPKAGSAQFAVAENYEHLGKWVDAMDAYTNYIKNFPSGSLAKKAQEQINWIKTYRL